MRAAVSAIAWTTGIIGLVIVLPLFMAALIVCPPKQQSMAGRIAMRLLLLSFWVRVRVAGLENVDRSRPCVFMANHASFFDFFILGGYLPGVSRGLEAAEHFSWPLWGAVLKQARMIPIDRSSAAASMRSMKTAAQRIGQGYSILVLPEGTRTVTGRLQPFRRLPFLIAKEAGCAIVPVGLRGTYRIKRKTSWILRPGSAEIRFGAPMDAAAVAAMDLDDLLTTVRDRIAELAG